MSKQSEAILEEQLVAQLKMLGYGYALINSEKDLILNLKTQLEKHNNITFSPTEFEKVLNILSKGTVFEKAKTLRQKQHIVRVELNLLWRRTSQHHCFVQHVCRYL